MALAKKCDRCGTYYDDNTKCEINNRKVIGIKTLHVSEANGGIFTSDAIDLCDDCRRSFYNWLAMA